MLNKIKRLEELVENQKAESKKQQKEKNLMQKALDNYSVPISIDKNEPIQAFKSKFILTLKSKSSRILKKQMLFLLPEEIKELSQSCKTIRLEILQKSYTIPQAVKNSGYDNKIIEWTRYYEYVKKVRPEITSQETSYNKIIKRFLIYDYDINIQAEDMISETCKTLDNQLQSYANIEEEKELPKESEKKNFRKTFLGLFKKDIIDKAKENNCIF